MTHWSTPADIRTRVRRRWDDGTILRAVATDEPFPVIDVPLRGPRPAEIGDDLDAVRAWIRELESSSRGRYDLITAPVGGRLIGRNEIPVRALVSSYEQAAALLGEQSRLREYRTLLSAVADEPDVLSWAVANPLRALDATDLWPTLLAAYRWLRDERGSNRYLREISAPDIDTKFVEHHRPLLATLLKVPATSTGFVAGLGLRNKPETLRLRFDPALGIAPGLTELTGRVEEIATFPLHVEHALIVENEITFLSVPVPTSGIVLWGKGFEVDRAASMPWLAEAAVDYWGDLDTHGFAILNRLRAWLPQTRSVLMDRETLLAHRDRWVPEPTPTKATLDRLTSDEAALYLDLVTDRFAERVRLEQERVDWQWAMEHLHGKNTEGRS